MAKLDVSNIPGYAEMTAEEKVKALEAYTLPDPDLTGYVKKSVFDDTASQLSALKKQQRERLTEEERKAQESKDLLDSLQQEVEKLRTEKKIGEYKASYLALGYTEELATSSAKAKAEGDVLTEFANQKKFMELHDKSVVADALKQTPRTPAGGSGENTVDYSKKIAEAQSVGDMAGAAAYIRLMQEQNNGKD